MQHVRTPSWCRVPTRQPMFTHKATPGWYGLGVREDFQMELRKDFQKACQKDLQNEVKEGIRQSDFQKGCQVTPSALLWFRSKNNKADIQFIYSMLPGKWSKANMVSVLVIKQCMQWFKHRSLLKTAACWVTILLRTCTPTQRMFLMCYMKYNSFHV